jgi:hypothetical protein
MSLLTIAFCVLLCACGGPTTTWSAEARSPDGYWLAAARSEQWSGPGNAYVATTVELKWLRGSQDPTEILSFTHQFATMNVKMDWITPKHLHVTYGESERRGDHVSLDFQVVKISGIDISVEYLPSDKWPAANGGLRD